MHWKRDASELTSIHLWLRKNFGSPLNCEQCGLIGEKVKTLRRNNWNIQWAKLKGKEYERERDNFWGLCSRCHRLYDHHSTARTLQVD